MTRLELDGHRLLILGDVQNDLVQEWLAGAPVFFVLCIRDVVTLDPLDEREGASPNRGRLAARTVWTVLVQNVEHLQEVEDVDPRLLGSNRHGVLVARLPLGVRGHKAGDDAGRQLEVQDAVEVVDNVVAGDFAPRVEGHALAQGQCNLLAVAALVPAFGERRLRLQVVVVFGQSVKHDPGAQACARRVVVAVDRRKIAGLHCLEGAA